MNKIYVTGLGPGAEDQMTIRARKVLERCPVIIGYTVYIDLIRDLFPGKIFLTTPMRREADRCRMAFEEAEKGQDVALVCSGDAGIYGMAGLICEIGKEYPETEIEIVPGLTAASAGAALLGAPLMHDFAVISLSDLLTPWETIEKRLRAAAAADFVICLYNPSSKKRADYLNRACRIILEYRDGTNVCGIAKNIGREGESVQILTLNQLKDARAAMFSTVFIGNSQTVELNGRMVTPRGYKDV